jgi:hypothetical protein
LGGSIEWWIWDAGRVALAEDSEGDNGHAGGN